MTRDIEKPEAVRSKTARTIEPFGAARPKKASVIAESRTVRIQNDKRHRGVKRGGSSGESWREESEEIERRRKEDGHDAEIKNSGGQRKV